MKQRKRQLRLLLTVGSVAAIMATAGTRVGLSAGQAAGGTIEGHIRATGPTPANPIIRLGADPKCAQLNAGRRPPQEYIVRSADGGIANVFVSVQGSFPGTPVPTTPVILNQKACIYQPRMVGARVGQTLQVTNDDPLLHNVHGLSEKGNGFDVGQPQAGMVVKLPLKNPEVVLHIKCDVHSWMNTYVGIVSHPYFAVTTDGGAFKITGVPAGRRTLQAWHEALGPLTLTVDVKAGQTVVADFNRPGSERPAPPGHAALQELVVHDGDVAIALER